MIRLQDIADMAGVSRTTVSNVINGNTKRVSQETIDKITAILKEQNYVPHMGSVMLSGHGSRIIGVVVGFNQAHGMQPLQDSFVGELVGTIQNEAEAKGYYIMLIGGENIQHVVDIASRWNVEGLIILGYNDEKYRQLSRKLNKKMVLIDTYPAGEYFFQNVGVDDYSGGYQIGNFRLGAAEMIDGLVVIPHNEKIVPWLCQHTHNVVLEVINVLELIHHNVLELILPRCQNILSPVKQLVTAKKHVIKIQFPPFTQGFLIACVNLPEHIIRAAGGIIVIQGDPVSFYHADLLCHILLEIPFLGQLLSVFQGHFLQNGVLFLLGENISRAKPVGML